MSTNRKVYEKLAESFTAFQSCIKFNNIWSEKWSQTIEKIQSDYLPSGSGIDSGTVFDYGLSKPDCLVLITGFHHMNKTGMYTHWTEHTIRAYPNFVSGIKMTISGRNDNDIKEYLYEVFFDALTQEYKG